MITRAQKQRLRDLGYGEAQIREMKPAAAHAILGKATPSAARSPEPPNDAEPDADPAGPNVGNIAEAREGAKAGDRPPYHVTVLQARANIRLGKTWQLDADGEPECVEAYGRTFDADTAFFETFDELCRHVDRISKLKGAA